MVGCTAPLLSRVKACSRFSSRRGRKSPGAKSDSLAKLRMTSVRPCNMKKDDHCTASRTEPSVDRLCSSVDLLMQEQDQIQRPYEPFAPAPRGDDVLINNPDRGKLALFNRLYG